MRHSRGATGSTTKPATVDLPDPEFPRRTTRTPERGILPVCPIGTALPKRNLRPYSEDVWGIASAHETLYGSGLADLPTTANSDDPPPTVLNDSSASA